MIKGDWEHPDRRTRRYYSITAAGRREHKRLLAELEPFLDSVIRSVTLIKREIYGSEADVESLLVEASLAEIWDHYFEPRGWPAWVDGFHAVESRTTAIPSEGGTLVWRSTPAGRGHGDRAGARAPAAPPPPDRVLRPGVAAASC